MILTRNKGKRMWGGDDSSLRVGSGGGGSGGVSQSWVEENFISKEFFNRLFQAYNGSTLVSPNDAETTITNIKAMFGFWTEQYISALGLNSSGDGGTSLNALLNSINVSNIGNTAPSSDNVGKCLVYNGSGQWTWATPGGGGGSGGTLTSIGLSMPTGFQVAESPLTADGTFQVTFANGYSLPTDAKQTQWDTAYTNNHTHSNKTVLDGISSTKVSNWDAAYTYALDMNTTRTAWGKTFWNNGPANVSGSISAGSDGGIIEAFHCIELNSEGSLSGYGGFIDFHYNGAISDYTSRIIEETAGILRLYGSLRIGDAVLSWDSTNNALKVAAQDGTAVNLYAVGGVSALGIGGDSGGSIVNLTVTNRLTITGSNYSHHINGNSNGMLVIEGSEGIVLDNDVLIDGFNLRIPDGRIYLDSSRYLYINSGVLYYYNGTSSIQIAS